MGFLFVGAVEEGWLTLNALLESPSHRAAISDIVTLTEEKGRSLSGFRSFDGLAKAHGVALHKIDHIRSPESARLIRRLQPELIIVVGWTQLLGEEVLSIPPNGCIGLHTTLLPRHRGRAPIPWAIIKGLGKTGNTLFYFTPGVDDGDIIGQKSFYITLEDTADSVYRKATRAGIDLLFEHWEGLAGRTAPRSRQDASQVDYWGKRTPEDGRIDWSLPARNIHDLIRGVTHPYPGAFTFHRGVKLLIWKSSLLGEKELDLDIAPGVVLDADPYSQGLVVGTGQGALMITEGQWPGGEPTNAWRLHQERAIDIGDAFESHSGQDGAAS